MDGDTRRRLRAKRFNEHIKLFVTSMNVIALTVFGAGVLQPLIAASATPPVSSPDFIWITVSIALHLLSQGMIRFIQLE